MARSERCENERMRTRCRGGHTLATLELKLLATTNPTTTSHPHHLAAIETRPVSCPHTHKRPPRLRLSIPLMPTATSRSGLRPRHVCEVHLTAARGCCAASCPVEGSGVGFNSGMRSPPIESDARSYGEQVRSTGVLVRARSHDLMMEEEGRGEGGQILVSWSRDAEDASCMDRSVNAIRWCFFTRCESPRRARRSVFSIVRIAWLVGRRARFGHRLH